MCDRNQRSLFSCGHNSQLVGIELVHRLGRHPGFLAGEPRRLGSVPQPLSFLSDGFEGLAMMVADLTRALRQSSEPFSLVPACLRG